MALLTLCIIVVIPACLLASPQTTADAVNLPEPAGKLSLDPSITVILKRLEDLEGKFEEEKRHWQRSINRLQKENRRLSKDNRQWQNRWQISQIHSDQLKTSVLSLQQKVNRLDLIIRSHENCSCVENECNGKMTNSPSHATTSVLKQRSAKWTRQDQQPQVSDDTNAYAPVVGQMDQRLGHVEAEVEALKDTNVQQDHVIQEAGTSTFVRWGHSQCPSSSQIVYSGVVGGGYHSEPGSTGTVLCLHLTPTFGQLPLTDSISLLYGGQYSVRNESHHGKDPVCAVCRTPRPTTIMVPGTNVCEAGWTLEYGGFLMSSHPQDHANHETVCVDSEFESRMGSDSDESGVVFYLMYTHCGSLPCPPYQNDKEVTCAICSK